MTSWQFQFFRENALYIHLFDSYIFSHGSGSAFPPDRSRVVLFGSVIVNLLSTRGPMSLSTIPFPGSVKIA